MWILYFILYLANVKWIILVFREPSSNQPLFISEKELAQFAHSVVHNDGFCKMDCSVDDAKKLLFACGLRLPRAELVTTSKANGI